MSISRRRQLKFAGEDEIIAEVDRLAVNGYRKLGNWSLAMVCFHLGKPTAASLTPPQSTTPTPEQAAMQAGLIDLILTTGRPPAGFQPPPELIPTESCDAADIARFKQTLAELKAYPHSHVTMGPFGPVPIEKLRKLTFLHSAHHLSHLEPAPCPGRRERLQYANDDEVIADVERLRRGYTQAGGWSLPRMCAHLDKAVQYRMAPGPFPPNTPEQDARKETLNQVLATGKLPNISAPDSMLPPAGAGDEAIDAFIASMNRFKAFPGPIAPHRVFGHLDDAVARKLNLIHCAHHLSYLTPKS